MTTARARKGSGAIPESYLVFTDGRHWSAVAGHATLYKAWSRLVQVGSPHTDFPWTTGGAWTVYAVWTLTAAVLAVTSVQRRDQ
ncbi:hypothetical protein [Streptomyces sp. NPDC093514]|uniref:hypothetical protein n=1 Tax=Streptomyces sp. NPDC093514 TaxID=3366039 RepID=UPI0037FE292C